VSLRSIARRLLHRLSPPPPPPAEPVETREFAEVAALHAKLDNLLLHINRNQRELRMLAGRALLPSPELWQAGPPAARSVGDGMMFPCSTLCRQDSFEMVEFHQLMRLLGLPASYRRKDWEFAFILQSLSERGMLVPGARGLGFGVGEERLTAFFASKGCRITGTDMAMEAAVEAGWTATSEHAKGKEALRFSDVCDDEVFDANVEFRTCDMNAIPDDLTGYDFCWSACALEHLGSIEKGLQFIERSIACLRPGGIAVHTTEFNLSHSSETVDHESTVLFRGSDLQELRRRVLAAGCEMAPLDLNPGQGPVDRYVDLPPYRSEPHLTLSIYGFSATSVGLIIRAPGG
jgi:2-polyprenyl-3-methyl-5-hydroxy-6-metoxy-1,4-benzoquinol methylase